MSSLIYKNLLIIHRGGPNIEYLKKINVYFEDNVKPFTYTNPDDKIVFCFESPLRNDDAIETLKPDHNFDMYKYEYSKNNLICIIKIYNDKNNLMIYDIRYDTLALFKDCFIVFKQFLIKNYIKSRNILFFIRFILLLHDWRII